MKNDSRTNDQKRRAVRDLLADPAWVIRGNRAIAYQAQVCQDLVKKVRGPLGPALRIGRDNQLHQARRATWQTRRQLRAAWEKEANNAGVPIKALHQHAAEILAHDKAHKAEILQVLKEARRLSIRLGHGALTRLAGAFRGGDHASLRGFDEVAEEMARCYAGILGTDPRDAQQKLFDLLALSNPVAMSLDEAYRRAFGQLVGAAALEPAGGDCLDVLKDQWWTYTAKERQAFLEWVALNDEWGETEEA